MRILIDATCITDQMDGWARYSYNLMKQFSLIDKENEYTILLQKANLSDNHPIFKLNEMENFSLKRVGFGPVGPIREFKFLLARLSPDYDVFHCLGTYLPIFQNYKSVVTVHDLKYLRYPNLWGKGFHFKVAYMRSTLKKALSKAKRVIADSQDTKEDIVNFFGISEDKIKVIYLATDLKMKLASDSACSILEKYSINKPYFLYLGVNLLHKNLNGLIEAFAEFKEIYDKWNTKLLITGKQYSAYNTHLNKAKKVGIIDNIIFTGFVPDEHLPLLYQEAEAFLFPSFHEGFGLPILEAMECGTPVITSNVSAMPEVAGNAALLVDPNNPKEIAQKMFAIMDSEDLKREYIEKGYERVKKFSWGKTAQETLTVYNFVLSKT